MDYLASRRLTRPRITTIVSSFSAPLELRVRLAEEHHLHFAAEVLQRHDPVRVAALARDAMLHTREEARDRYLLAIRQGLVLDELRESNPGEPRQLAF